jgi:CDP-diacylglycerol pyrophosphatase
MASNLKSPIWWFTRPSIVAFALGSAAVLCNIAWGSSTSPSGEGMGAKGSNTLWRVVHDLCVMDMKVNGIPAPCSVVDLHLGYAVLKDIGHATQFLLIPTDRISGIEDPTLLAPSSVNYWQAAWEARRLYEHRVGRTVPREDIGLAVNSAYGRSQNQLHIHIDCVRADVQQMLRANEERIGFRWSDLTDALAGRHYRVMRIQGADLGSRDPFKLLAGGDSVAYADMARETLVVIGYAASNGKPGFILLSDRVDSTTFDRAHGEDLLDHKCKTLAAHAE